MEIEKEMLEWTYIALMDFFMLL